MERILVTGGTGCIGAWVMKNIIESGRTPVLYSPGADKLDKLSIIMSAAQLKKVVSVKGDVTVYDDVVRAIKDHGVSKIIHLAALQMPFCKQNPVKGAAVNVMGTMNVFQAAKAAGINKIVYASSTAVYGNSSDYEGGAFSHNSPLIPSSFYGVTKVDNEQAAKIWWRDEGIASFAIRPFVVYGPLRDQGMTSSPTTAMKAAAKGEKYQITYGGEAEYQYTDDAAKAFLQAADADFTGAEAYNLGGGTSTVAQIVDAVEAALPSAKGLITFNPAPLPFPRHNDTMELEKALGSVKRTSIKDGVAKSLDFFKAYLKNGGVL